MRLRALELLHIRPLPLRVTGESVMHPLVPVTTPKSAFAPDSILSFDGRDPAWRIAADELRV